MMRERLKEIFMAGVAAADPAAAVTRALAGRPRPTRILAVGKAGCQMARAARAVYGDVVCLIVTNPENAADVPGARVVCGAHPVPDETSLAAGQAVLSFLASAGTGDHVLALISGGGSALCVAPVAGVTLADKQAVNTALLGAGLDIVAMNRVRQGLSRIKGGGLLAAAAPAQVTSLILSDVVGDDLRAVASGPTVAPIGRVAQARAVLEKAGLWDAMPASVRAALSRADPLPPPAADATLIGSNGLSVRAMAAAAPQATQIDVPLVGDVGAAADTIVALARTGAGLWVMGGETTVHLRGRGTGGRNQELALRVAKALSDHAAPFVFLSGGTDGRDGPTDAAGGLVDNGTWGRIGVRAQGFLDNNDSHAALRAAGDLLVIPATGTNVADLQILWVGTLPR
jgi:glycerate 2-kinase